MNRFLEKPTVIEPSITDWQPRDLVRDVLELMQWEIQNGRYGPFVVLLGMGWESYLDLTYSVTNLSGTLCANPRSIRQRIADVNNVMEVKVIPDVSPFCVIVKDVSYREEK